ncbi:threonylcarbamoyl-AMP synthase [Candidatus Poribacteria bacterium]|nr:threonylcarbamoyl-AMP synthase [Candidatus Poribacteria bacterium]
MSPKIVPIETGIFDAVRAIRAGGVVALPTDTVYGIGVDPANAAAIRRLFSIKRRDGARAIPILLADVAHLGDVCDSPSEAVMRLAEAFLPGPLTLVVSLSAELPSELNAESGTVGVRVPDHDGARDFIRACGGMLAVTSANISGEPPATCVADLSAELLGLIDVVLDGGPTPGGAASTVVDARADPPAVLRQGPLTAADLGI